MTKVSGPKLLQIKEYALVNEEPIGKGGFSLIYLVENKTTKRRYAAKIILNSPSSREDQQKFISREISILTRVQAQTIIRFQGFSLTDFQGYPNITILMDYKENGSLKKLIEREQAKNAPRDYNNTAKQIILCGIAHGMMTLHSRRVLHRDLKPDNVLLDSEFKPCITDFGLSKFSDPEHSGNQSMNGCGTPRYMAPEIIDGTHYGFKSDVYSFGILMYEVLAGKEAFSEEMKKKKISFIALHEKILQGVRPEFDFSIKPSLKELIERCWSGDPKQRPTFQELFIKLSLSLDDDDAVEHAVFNLINNDDSAEHSYNSRYSLDNVDARAVSSYVDEITIMDTDDEVFEHIKELEKRLQKYRSEGDGCEEGIKKNNERYRIENQDLKKEEAKYLQEIDVLKYKIEEMNLKLGKGLKPRPPSTLHRKHRAGDSFDGLTFQQMKEQIQESKLKKITIPSTVTSIEQNAFYACRSLTHITIPSTVISIGDNAFAYCSSLQYIEIPSSVTTIGNYAFAGCSKLPDITIPSTVTSIGASAFSTCTSLNAIVISSFATSIGDGAFRNCHKLQLVIREELKKHYGDGIFT